jgi:malate dehydrogenase (oxaloacetate-decarboxylating)(NADP+)
VDDTRRFNRDPCTDGELPTGVALLRDPVLNKGSAFTEAERDALGLRGLLPACVCQLEEQVERVLTNLRRYATDLDRYVQLASLQVRNETLFYRVVMDHLEEMMPIIYTPTVGEACQEYGHIFQRTKGMFISAKDQGQIARVLRNWPCSDMRIIVVTDGERILGLGDQGADGMGIPVGKLALYTACAGIHPSQCLPIMLDVGTNNETLLEDPFYIGIRQPRLRGEAYDAFVDEFVEAVQEVFPAALIQFEDFANQNAFRLLEKYRGKYCTFNDDIQGTGAVALAGLLAAPRITGIDFKDQTFLFMGAGEAGIGIADMIVGILLDEGLPEKDAKRRCWFVDSKGLVIAARRDLNDHKRKYAHEHEPIADFLTAVESLKPTGIIGVSGQQGSFSPAILEAMAKVNKRPIVFALSNPTSKAECTAEDAYTHTDGRAVFASGSPFQPVTYDGLTFVPGQGNNAYIFPGVGLGVIASGSRLVTDEMFFVAAKALAAQVTDADLAQGRVYPPLANIRGVSAVIGTAVAEVAYARGLARRERPEDLLEDVRSRMYQPVYYDYL